MNNVPILALTHVSSLRHHVCPSGVRFRNLDDLNRDFEDTMFPRTILSLPPQLTQINAAFSKTMQLMFTKDLQHRLDAASTPILCIGLDPGEVLTGTICGVLPLSSLAHSNSSIPRGCSHIHRVRGSRSRGHIPPYSSARVQDARPRRTQHPLCRGIGGTPRRARQVLRSVPHRVVQGEEPQPAGTEGGAATGAVGHDGEFPP